MAGKEPTEVPAARFDLDQILATFTSTCQRPRGRGRILPGVRYGESPRSPSTTACRLSGVTSAAERASGRSQCLARDHGKDDSRGRRGSVIDALRGSNGRGLPWDVPTRVGVAVIAGVVAAAHFDADAMAATKQHARRPELDLDFRVGLP